MIHMCATVPLTGTPYRRPASSFEVPAKPAMYAARAASTAASSCVRRVPNSKQGRSPAARSMRAALGAESQVTEPRDDALEAREDEERPGLREAADEELADGPAARHPGADVADQHRELVAIGQQRARARHGGPPRS